MKHVGTNPFVVSFAAEDGGQGGGAADDKEARPGARSFCTSTAKSSSTLQVAHHLGRGGR